jgi:hypothetical protein
LALFFASLEPTPIDANVSELNGRHIPSTAVYASEQGSQRSVILIGLSTGEPYELTSTSDGVLFDMDANGAPRRTAWTTTGSHVAFLALDQNGDGSISNGDELIGSHRAPDAPNAFTALQALTRRSNGGVARGSISSDDPLFERLLLWTDVNHDGRSQPSEIQHASAVISDVGLGYAALDHWDANGNEFRYRGWVAVRTAPGRNALVSPEDNERRVRNIWEVVLASRH